MFRCVFSAALAASLIPVPSSHAFADSIRVGTTQELWAFGPPAEGGVTNPISSNDAVSITP